MTPGPMGTATVYVDKPGPSMDKTPRSVGVLRSQEIAIVVHVVDDAHVLISAGSMIGVVMSATLALVVND